MQNARSWNDTSDDESAPRTQQSPGPTDYEFDSNQNSIFSGLASAMRFVGTTSIVLGLVFFLGVLGGDVFKIISALVQGALSLVVGLWLRKAASSIDHIVTTEGNDVSNLMAAMVELRKVYRLQRVLIIVALAIMAVAFVAVLAATK